MEGKGLSANDFTDAFMTKLDDLYNKAQLDLKFNDATAKIDAVDDRVDETNARISALEYSKVTVVDDDTIELELL